MPHARRHIPGEGVPCALSRGYQRKSHQGVTPPFSMQLRSKVLVIRKSFPCPGKARPAVPPSCRSSPNSQFHVDSTDGKMECFPPGRLHQLDIFLCVIGMEIGSTSLAETAQLRGSSDMSGVASSPLRPCSNTDVDGKKDSIRGCQQREPPPNFVSQNERALSSITATLHADRIARLKRARAIDFSGAGRAGSTGDRLPVPYLTDAPSAIISCCVKGRFIAQFDASV